MATSAPQPIPQDVPAAQQDAAAVVESEAAAAGASSASPNRQLSLHEYMQAQKKASPASPKRVTTSPMIDALPAVHSPKAFTL